MTRQGDYFLAALFAVWLTIAYNVYNALKKKPMKSFQLKAHLAAGLSYRLSRLDEQKVAETLAAMKPSKAVRSCLKVSQKIHDQNFAYMDVTKKIYDLKTAASENLQKRVEEQSAGMDAEGRQKVFLSLRPEFDAECAKIQADNPSDELAQAVVTFTLADEEYADVLLPLFEKTVGTWDAEDAKGNGVGLGQKFFAEVADAIEAVTEAA